LEGRQQAIRDTLFGAYCGGAKPGMRCVRQGDWKLIQYQSAEVSSSQVQLFNLRENPHEFLDQHASEQIVSLLQHSPEKHQRNLAADPAYHQQLKSMQQLLLSEMRRLDDPYRFSDQPADDLPELDKKFR
jgi:arylsulfatase A-like enzyme